MADTPPTSILRDELRLGSPSANDYEIAEWNLILAHGLPGAENLDIPRLLEA